MQCNGLKTEISGVAEFGDGGSHINPPLASTMQWRVSKKMFEIRGSSMVLILKVIGVLIGMLNENFPKILDNLCENLVPCCLTTPQLHLLPQGSFWHLSKNFRGPFCDFVHPRNSTSCSAISKWIYLVLETSKWDLKKVWTKLEKYPSLFSSQWHARILTILKSPNFN